MEHSTNSNWKLPLQPSLSEILDITKAYDIVRMQMHLVEESENNCECEQIMLVLIDQVTLLRNFCSCSSACQSYIAMLPNIFVLIKNIVSEDTYFNELFIRRKKPLEKMVWQLLANICVQNYENQSIVWQNFDKDIYLHLADISPFTDIQLMILYNIFKGNIITDHRKVFSTLANICGKLLQEENANVNLEFLHIFLEYFLIEYPRLVTLYGPLEGAQRIHILQYLSSYIQNQNSIGLVSKNFLQYISKEFKMKSDCILKTVESYVDKIQPQEVISLLDVISKASGDERYTEVYINDSSLFLNVGSLLKALNAIGKKSENVFTPMQKLEQVATCSKIDTNFERDISFEMKTMLVRTLANLLHRNKKNQEYARELDIIITILDCTTVDARNPLIKEWSILAVRNLCEGCPENQEFISKLCKVGDVPNDMLKELSLEMGSLRIQPNV